MQRIQIFDTTLRDGEQTPGVALGVSEKLEIAQSLARLKVDAIEAGFPCASVGDFKAVSAVAEKIRGPIITALARCNEADIDIARDALQKAEKSRIHVFLATSDIHMKYKLNMTAAEVLENVQKGVCYARNFVEQIEFSAEDASRSDWDFLCKVYETAIDSGATIINVPDTVGYAIPEEFGAMIKYLRNNIRNIDKAMISVHCHNDLGLAVANSLAAIKEGATQIETTINGIGERAGNTAMEELIMLLHTKQSVLPYTYGIDTKQIYRASRIVSTLTGVPVQPNKAVVGDNAFAHESGIHQHGVLNNPLTYEIMNPETIGISSNAIVLGKHSGKHAFADKLVSLGYDLTNAEIAKLFVRFKDLADKKKVVFDKDIEAMVAEKTSSKPEWYKLIYHQVNSSNQSKATAVICLESADGRIEEVTFGDGPVDAVYQAINKATGLEVTLKDYQVKAITSDTDALGEATIWLQYQDRVYTGRGLSTDVIEASVKGYINAINGILAANDIAHIKQGGEK